MRERKSEREGLAFLKGRGRESHSEGTEYAKTLREKA